MQKRGSIHLDWVISIGIFLVYVTSIFLLVKPGYTPVYEGDVFLNILQRNFDGETKWNITKMPLYIKSTGSAESVCSQEEAKPFNFEMKFPYDWNKNNIFMKKDNVNFGDFDIGVTDSGDPLLKLKENSISDFNFNIYSSNKDYSNYRNNPYACDPPSNCKTLSQDCFTYSFGVSELLTGIDKSNIINNENQIPLDLYFGNGGTYPGNNEYNISVWDTNNKAIWSSVGKVGQPPVNSVVYVRQYKDWILKEDGEREDITVRILSW